MIKFLNKYKFLLLIFIISFAIFYPSLFTFFTNDDFFFLKISNVNNITGFLNFFSLSSGPDGFGMYRPLTTQAFYFLSVKLFNISAIPLHIISFVFFFGVIYLINRFVVEMVNDEKVGLLSAFLYAVSATHFGHLYYLATFQEIGVTFFVLLSCLFFIKRKYILSFIFFVLGLLSKETAVVTPVLLGMIYLYQKYTNLKVVSFKKLLITLTPFVLVLLGYMYMRFVSYGFATGDSYVWDFSLRKLLNTSFWYLLWSFNIPESLVDFVGPGIKINANLFLYWGSQVRPILVLFTIQAIVLIYVLIKTILSKTKSGKKENDLISTFCIGWFFITLLPVIFLPLHKFTFYLTLPLIAVVFRISYLFIVNNVNKFVIGVFLLLWTITSVLTLRFTYETNWITQSQLISRRVFEYFKQENEKYKNAKILFIDTKEDEALPWSPTSVVRTVLSSNNFFAVFYPDLSKNIYYSESDIKQNEVDVKIESRQFLGY